ncbi:zinc-binding dehydrogenase [Marinoscillum furvescens]|uniref:D-arabinose 1-dehydrogenase-like Zn-dependent alcohol dehydrogenase n=1 Tax=Marinoscillum furvescens DSM 4134 TaxID=1122208 RepID=A0A3D9L9K0_MARFU|nr:zinc-binding dehydrogenase [Marinoscillum furvescens]REE02147.1 D-arabinose 1-dehydrogenase-like Zn-dependent alcohol dehydrogenase [Marinoscillum furvescens DSM 4134]
MQGIILSNETNALTLAELPKPTLKPGQCLVKLSAAALNRRDYWISVGKYPGIQPEVVLGSDGCGVVVDGPDTWKGKTVLINPNVNWGASEQHQSSDYSVLGMPTQGTLAEYIAVDEDRLMQKPVHLSDEEGAALPLAGLTAFRATFVKAKVTAGKKVLVTGVGGGVSQMAAVMAIAAGAEVYVTSSSEDKLNKARKLGATAGFNYQGAEWVKEAKSVGGFDAIVDSAGGNALNDYLKLIKPGGKIVHYGSTTGKPQELDLFRLFWSQASIIGSTMGSDREFEQMVAFVEEHQIRPAIDGVYALSSGVEAIERMADSSQFGKTVIRMEA